MKKRIGEFSLDLLFLPCCVCMNCGTLVILSYLSNDYIGKVIIINSNDDKHLPIAFSVLNGYKETECSLLILVILLVLFLILGHRVSLGCYSVLTV